MQVPIIICKESADWNVEIISNGFQRFEVWFASTGFPHTDGAFGNTESLCELKLGQVVLFAKSMKTNSKIGHGITS